LKKDRRHWFMAQRRQQYNVSTGKKKKKELYIYGNTVRELQVEKSPAIERQQEGQREYNQRRRSDREYAISMNKGYVMFLVIAAAVVFVSMGYFLMLSAEVSDNQSAVAEMKSGMIDLKADNDDYERRIERSVDIDEIRRIAIEELGMVYPSSDQVVNYEYEESDFVRQYSDVPKD